MLMPNRLYPHLSYEVITEVAQIVDNNLRDGWLIRIEYTEEVEYLNTSWHRWGEDLFNITNVSDVIDSIRSCHMKNQFCAIRLRAEKLHPRSTLYFCVCQ